MTVKTKVPPITSRNGAQQAVKKLDIACGQNKQVGYKGIDISGDADIVHDLFEFPWPIKTSCVQEVFCSHFIEHVPHDHPGWEKDGWFLFFDELYRIMKRDGVAQFHHPYAKNDRAFWDPTHVRFVHEVSWYYLDKSWREMQGLDHYPADHDFEVVTINTDLQGDLASRHHEAQAYARNHYWNAVGDLSVFLKVRK